MPLFIDFLLAIVVEKRLEVVTRVGLESHFWRLATRSRVTSFVFGNDLMT